MNDSINYPKQKRSRETLDRILKAAKELISEKGRQAPSITDITDRADCSVGCFYGRFEDKKSLYTYLDRQLFEDSTNCWRDFLDPDKWEGKSVENLICKTVDAMVDSYRQNAKILRALYMHWRTMPPGESVQSAADKHYNTIFQWYSDLLQERSNEFDHPNPDLAAAFLIETVESILIERIAFEEDRFASTTTSDVDLKVELINMALGYLGVKNFKPGEVKPEQLSQHNVDEDIL